MRQKLLTPLKKSVENSLVIGSYWQPTRNVASVVLFKSSQQSPQSIWNDLFARYIYLCVYITFFVGGNKLELHDEDVP